MDIGHGMMTVYTMMSGILWRGHSWTGQLMEEPTTILHILSMAAGGETREDIGRCTESARE